MIVSTRRTTYRNAARGLLRSTSFAAAREELARRPWSKIPMAEIAVRAGISRQTLYNEFGNREQFGQALVLHEAERFIEGVESALRANFDDPYSAVAAALEQFLEAAPEDPLVGALLRDEGDGGLLPFVTTRGLPIVTWAAGRIAAVVAEGWPGIERRDARLLAETLVRLAISYVTTPDGPPAETADACARLIAPFADRALRLEQPGSAAGAGPGKRRTPNRPIESAQRDG